MQFDWRHAFLVAARGLLLAAVPPAARATTVVPESVATVLTGGYWSHDGKSGTYRLVIVNEGSDPITSRVFVEWLAQSPSGLALVTRVEPKLPFGNGKAQLRAVMRAGRPGRVQIQLVGNLAEDPGQKVRAVVIAMKPGNIAVGSVRRKPSGDSTAAPRALGGRLA